MFKLIRVLSVLALVAMNAGLSFGASTDTIALTVTPLTNVQVNIVEGAYDFSTGAAYATTTLATVAINVVNLGTSAIKFQDKTDVNNGTWTRGAAAGANTFCLYSLETADASAQPTAANVSTVVTAGYVTLNGAASTASSATREIWLKLDMPTTGGTVAQQSITYYVQGSAQ